MKKNSEITRRDFLNGTLLALGSTLLPPLASGKEIENLIASDHYPPLLNGLRGSHNHSYDTAHQLAWSGKNDWHKATTGKTTNNRDEHYDLVMVGGGISGLAAARFYQQKYGTDKKILIVDNHDDFGGHARRNEFDIDGQTRIGYGGSQSMEDPGDYSEVTKALLKDLGVNTERFYQAYNFDFFNNHNLKSTTFFDEKTFGKNQLIPFKFSAVEGIPGLPQGSDSYAQAIAKMPLPKEAKEQLLRICNADDDTLEDISVFSRVTYAEKTLYFDYLKEKLGVNQPQVFEILRYLSAGNMGVGADTYTVIEAAAMGLPGIKPGAIVPLVGDKIFDSTSGEEEPYIFHFPDGNASIARLLVRKMIPAVAAGNTMDDIVLSRFKYDQLDQPQANVRLRLNSTVIKAEHQGTAEKSSGVKITYIHQKQTYQVTARHCVMACYNMMIPYLVPGLPTPQKAALKHMVKSPLVYTSVVLKNWSALKKLGVGAAYCPGKMHTFVALDYPVSMGGYQFPESTDEAITLRMEYIPCSTQFGLPPKDQFREGRYKLLGTSFAQFETEIKQHLKELLGPGGFDPEKDIQAITVNRWSHGYAYSGNDYYDPKFYDKGMAEIARQPFGRITIANSDSGASAYMNSAIDQAWRAVEELDG